MKKIKVIVTGASGRMGMQIAKRIVHVIGTTGFSKSQLRKIDFAAQHATIIKSGNMSLGINLLENIV